MANYTSKNINDFLGELHKMYNILLANQDVINKAMLATDAYITVDVPSMDGETMTQVTVPSFSYIQEQQNSMKQNIEAMSKLQDGSGYVALVDEVNGKIRQLFELSHNHLPYIGNTVPSGAYAEAFVDSQNDLINKLYSPNVSYALDCTDLIKNYSREVLLTKVNISDYEVYTANVAQLQTMSSYEDVKAFLNSNSIQYDEHSEVTEVEYYQSRYYGDFSVMNSVRNEDGTFTAKLDTVNYSDRSNNVKMSRELVKGSKLALLNENTLFNVLDVNVSTNTLILQRIYGFDELLVGVSNLTYVDDNTKRNVHVPIRFNENFLLFISATHLLHGTMSGKSRPIALSSRDIMITAGAETMTVNDYIKASNATDMKSLLQSMVTQSGIAIKHAIVPDKPTIVNNNFKVVQINKHVVEGSEVEYIKKLYASQNKINGEMKITVDTINKLNTTLEQANYKNESDRKEIYQQLQNAKSTYAVQQTEFSNIVTELSNKDIGLYASTYAPKYRVRGFWAVQDDMVSEYTRNQVILAYRVQFRYVSANNKIANSDNFSLYEDVNGEQVETTGSFSTWQEFVTPLRKRVVDPKTGSISYIPNNIGDSNQINMNQLDIAIQKNEQVDIRIQAISEVGYPNVLIQSEWSDTVRINFPPEFTTDIDFAKLQNEVNEAKQEVELRGLLQNEGLLKHVQNSASEQHTYLAHIASEIDSGFLSPELNKITLFDKLKEFQQVIDMLQNKIVGNSSTLKVTLEDEFGNSFAITNNASLKVFAGYYTDKATLEPKGDIINFQMYIRISNITPTQIYTLDAGDGNVISSNGSYNAIPVGYVQDDGTNVLPFGTPQTRAQIAYLRSRNVFNNGDLYVENPALTTPWSNEIPLSSIDTGATDNDKTVLHVRGSNLERVALNDSENTQFIAMSNAHPDFSDQSSNASIKAYLEKMSRMLTIPQGGEQLQADGNNEVKVCYAINDKFLIGELTTGSYLTFNSVNKSNLKVSTNAIDAYKEVSPNGDVLIPILFQYRMTDYLGRINGKPNVLDTNVTYTKRIGIDMLLNGVITKFDIEVSAKYSPSALSTNNIPKVGQVANLNNGSSMI